MDMKTFHHNPAREEGSSRNDVTSALTASITLSTLLSNWLSLAFSSLLLYLNCSAQ
jgi:hypothetical protein